MKSKKNLNYEEQKQLFGKFDYNTLDALEILYDVSKTEVPTSFSVVINKKYQAIKDEFEGMNEYTYNTRLDNFDISEITRKLPELDKKEIKYIMDLINDALNSINPDQQEMVLIPKVAECIKKYGELKLYQMEVLPCGMSREELEHFFDKYNIIELEHFNTILDFTDSIDKEEIRKVKEKIENKKMILNQKMVAGNIASPVINNNIKLPDLQRKNYKVTNKELEFFHDLVERAAGYLESIRDFEEEYQAIYEDFASDCYPIDQMAELLDAIELEQATRKNNRPYIK